MAYTTINKSSDYFNTVTYTGTHSSSGAKSITGVGFQPDWVWLKNRTSAGYDNRTYDAVRTATKILNINLTNAEGTDSQGLTAFGADGFTVGTGNGDNNNGNSYVGWNWKAGTTSGIATNAETDITPTAYSFNQTNGFSIVKYTGTGTSGEGVPHGLNAKPQMIIVKRLNANESWQVFTQPNINTSNATKYLKLDANNAEATSNSRWNGWQPDTYNFYLGNDDSVNASGGTYIAYVFAAKTGFSKIGSYTGNGNVDGTFVYTGFKPEFIMVKRTDTTSNWQINDSARDTFNLCNKPLYANTNEAEGVDTSWDALSNGFKMRQAFGSKNASGGTYLYMAFGQALVGTNGVTAKAR